MSILNVNQIQPVGGGNTVTVSASDVNFSGNISVGSNFIGIVTASTATLATTAILANTATTATLATTAILANTATVATNAQGLTGTPDITVNNIQSGVVTATTFIGDGSGLTGVTASGSGINIKDSGSTVGVAATVDFGTNLNVSPASAGIVTVTVGDTDFEIVDKIVHTGDTDTAIRFPAVDTFTVETAGSERLRITSDGSVGIGTDNPTSGNVAASSRFIHIHNSDTGATSPSEIYFTNNNSGVASNVGGLITFFNSDFYFWNYAHNDLIFGTGGAEKLRFDHSENTLDFKSTSKIRLKGSVSAGATHAHINIGSDASTSETRAIDIYGGWSNGEYKSITYNHGTSAADILAQQRVRYNNSPSSTYYEIGRLYHGQNTTAYPIRFVSTSINTANLEIDGNLNVSSGNGINFSAYATSGNPSSNLLDDYEEGTFLPTMFGSTIAGTSTYSLQYGYYVKVGKLVHFQIRMTVTSSTATGNMRIGGLPFVALNDTNRGYASVNVSYANNISLPSGSTWMGAYTSAGGSHLVLIGNTPGSVIQSVSVDTSWVALIGGTYIANV